MHLACLPARMLTPEKMYLVWEDVKRLSSMPAQFQVGPALQRARNASQEQELSKKAQGSQVWPRWAAYQLFSFFLLAGGCAVQPVWLSKVLQITTVLSVPKPLGHSQEAHQSPLTNQVGGALCTLNDISWLRRAKPANSWKQSNSSLISDAGPADSADHSGAWRCLPHCGTTDCTTNWTSCWHLKELLDQRKSLE